MIVLQHPAREVARWLRAEHDADWRWVRREIALRSDGMMIGRIDESPWVAVQPWRMGADLLCVLLQHAGFSRIS